MNNLPSKSILVFNGSSDLYGANRILSNTVSGLISDFNLTLYIPSSGPLLPYILENNPQLNIKIYKFFPLIHRQMRSVTGVFELNFNCLKFISHIIYNYKYFRSFDLIFINTLSCTPLILIFKLFGFKVVTHVHEILSNEEVFTHTINQLAVRFSDHLIGVSGQVSANLAKAFRNDKFTHKITTIWNGINDMLGQGGVSKSGNLIFTLFGRIKPEKGQWLLLEALSLLPVSCVSKVEFRIIGSPLSMNDPAFHDWLSSLESLRIETGLKIEVTNFVDNISTFMNETDVVLVPSIMYDPFPTVILEGLSAAKIVVASNRGGSNESIIDGVTGILFDPAQADEFSNILVKLILNFSAFSAMKKNARASYLENFTLATYKNKINSYISGLSKTV